jgi:hypothetical protein
VNKVQKLLLDIKMAEAKLEYAIPYGDEDGTAKHIAGWDYAGDLLIYASNRLTTLSPAEAKHFAEWILSMLEEQDEAAYK